MKVTPGRTPRLNREGTAKVRQEWGAWARGLTAQNTVADAITEAAISYLEAGLSAEVVASLIRLRLGRAATAVEDRSRIAWEIAYSERVRKDVADLLAQGALDSGAAAAIDREYAARLDALGTSSEAIRPAAEPGAVPAAPSVGTPARPTAAVQRAVTPTPLAAVPAPGPTFSLRDLLAEHSVLILASLGAFLLVVATVLFELYGTVGLGGTVRLGAVIALDLVFAAAGYLALGRPNLRSVGQIYTALAAVLLPLIAVAAWNFLALGAHGVTVDQALAITGAACAFVYGGVASRLGLRAYGEMAGAAIAAASFGASGWAGGPQWRSVGLGLAPLAFAVWTRAFRDPVFKDFQWFGNFVALVALAGALTFPPSQWQLTATLLALSVAYLTWQALSPHPSRAWIGELALIFAASAAVGPLGLSGLHFALPMVVGIPLLVLARSGPELGVVGTLCGAHPAHLHVAVALGVGLASAESVPGETWPLAASLGFAVALYGADYWLGRSAITGYALRAAIPLALAAAGRAGGFGPWTATLVASSGLGYLVPFVAGPRFNQLTRRAWAYFYGLLVIVAVELRDALIGAGHWEIPAALLVSTAAFGIASELKQVRFSAIAARGIFALAWFSGVDATGAAGWRGPFDALLALVYVALAQLRGLRTHSVASAGSRWLIHVSGAGALVLCFAGPNDLLWWRLAAALGVLAVAYWWITLARANTETPALAWGTLSMAAVSLAFAAVPFEWQGAFVAAFTVIATGTWAIGRRLLLRRAAEGTGFVILSATALFGVLLSLVPSAPRWSQSIALMLVAAFALGWWLIPSTAALRAMRPGMRSVAAAFASVGVLVGASVLELDSKYVGLIALAIAAAHAEWNVRSTARVERGYAIGAVLALAPVIYSWPHEHTPPGLVAAYLVALAALSLAAGIRRPQWFLAYPTAILLVPALHLVILALGLGRDARLEESWMAGLAWVVGLTGLVVRASSGRRWALATEAAAITIAVGSLVAMASSGYADPAGISLLAYAPLIYTAAMQERQRWVLPVAASVALLGAVILLSAHNADTIYYAAALGVLGLLIWLAGRVASTYLARDPLVDMHRYLGLGMLGASSVAGFFFPDRTGPHTLGASLAALGWLITGGVLWLDSVSFSYRPNRYVALFAATTAGYFVARDVNLPEWQLVPPGLGLIACGILLRADAVFVIGRPVRRLTVGAGIGLVAGWAAVLTVTGDPSWLVILLVEGALTVAAGITLRTRVLLAAGGAALGLASLRALLNVAEAGYLFAAFAVVALVLLAVATALALGRERYRVRTREMRQQLAQWD